MDFAEAVRRRRMVRSYLAEPVAADSLDRILDAARRSPSAGFTQAVELVVVTSPDRRRAIAAAAGESSYAAQGLPRWLSTAPVHVVVAVEPAAYERRYGEADKSSADGPEAWTAPYWWVDAGAVLMLLLLATANEGLAAGFLGAHAIDGLADIIGLPATYEVLGLVTIGHAVDDEVIGSARRPRRPLGRTEHDETWGNPRRPEPRE